MTDAEALLADVHTLRRRTRRDRQGYAFPLLLFGALIMLAPLCYVPIDVPPDTASYVTYPGAFPIFNGIGPFGGQKYPNLVSWYWFLTIVGGFAATAWWYRRRAVRVGVETGSTAYLLTAGAALAGFVLGMPVLQTFLSGPDMIYIRSAATVPILIGSAVAAAGVLLLAARLPGLARTIAVFAGVLLATVAFSMLGVYLIYGFVALLIIAAGLLALAWLERSVLLGVTGLAFTAASLLANLLDLRNPIWGDTLYTSSLQSAALRNLLLPGGILLVGGAVAVLSGRVRAR
jgi:hypothetical protein